MSTFKRFTRSFIGAGLLAAGLVAPLMAVAETYPDKPIRMIVPTAPAGGNDFMARIIGQKLQERLGKPVVVENKTGAGGTIGTDFVAKAKPDGYTILFGYIATHGINPAMSKLPYDAVRDFAPITQVAEAQTVIVVNPSVPVNSLQELITLAKAKPGTLNYASAGKGTLPHIAGELFKQLTGTDIGYVHYKGSSPAATDTLAGHTQIMFGSLVTAISHIKAGKLKALAVTGSKRSPLLPDVPTVSEAGLQGFEVAQWYGLFAPANTPKAIIDKLNQETIEVLKNPEVATKFAEQGADVVTGSPADFGRLVEVEIARWSEVSKKANITAGY